MRRKQNDDVISYWEWQQVIFFLNHDLVQIQHEQKAVYNCLSTDIVLMHTLTRRQNGVPGVVNARMSFK